MSAIMLINNNEWDITEINGEPCIKDTVLAERLGYDRPRKIRELIKRMVENGSFGVALPWSDLEKTSKFSPVESEVFYLNEKQSLKVIAKSETETADQIMDEVIDVFLAFRNGKIQQQANMSPMEILAQMALRLVDIEKSEKRVIALESKANRLENNIKRTLTDIEHFTVIAYANLNGIESGTYHSASIGKKAKKISKEMGYKMGSVVDPKYGNIGTYHRNVLDIVFKAQRVKDDM